MQHIETVTVGAGGAASITFSAIPDTFTDLLLVCNLRSTRASTSYTNGKIGINGLTTGYSTRTLLGQQSSGSNVTTSNTALIDGVWSFTFPSAQTTANTFGNALFYFPNYKSSVAKSVSIDNVSENNLANDLSWQLAISAGLNTTTNPITSIEVGIRVLDFATIVEYSSASLYGILAGSDGIVSVS